MGQKVQDIIIDEFLGVDSESDPTNLPLNISPGGAIRNMYPSPNKTQIRKRPGVGQGELDLARSGPIYHMARGALVLSGAVAGPEVLFMVYGGGAGAVNAATYDIDNDTIVDFGATNYTTDPRYMASLVLASRNFALITAPESAANWSFIEAFSSIAPFYRLGSYAHPLSPSTIPFPIAAWQRQHHWVGDGLGANAARLLFSNFDTPTTFAAVNFVDVEPRGYRDAARGFFRIGDALYIGKTDRTYVLTGANDETFVLEQTRIPFGFGGMRGWAPLSGGRGIGFVHRPKDTPVAIGREASLIENIGVIAGLDGETVGDRVLSLIRTTSSGGATSEAFAESTSRTIDWPALLGTLFMPQGVLGFDPAPNVPLLFRNKEDGSFWPWTLDDAIQPIAFEFSGNQIFIGCADGQIRRFDPSALTDGGVNFPGGTFYQTPPLWQGKPHVKWTIAYIRIYGSQTLGGQASVQVATDFAALGTAQTFDLDEDGAELRFNGKVTEGYFQEVRITVANNSQEGTIRKIVIGAIATGKSAKSS